MFHRLFSNPSVIFYHVSQDPLDKFVSVKRYRKFINKANGKDRGYTPRSVLNSISFIISLLVIMPISLSPSITRTLPVSRSIILERASIALSSGLSMASGEILFITSLTRVVSHFSFGTSRTFFNHSCQSRIFCYCNNISGHCVADLYSLQGLFYQKLPVAGVCRLLEEHADKYHPQAANKIAHEYLKKAETNEQRRKTFANPACNLCCLLKVSGLFPPEGP